MFSRGPGDNLDRSTAGANFSVCSSVCRYQRNFTDPALLSLSILYASRLFVRNTNSLLTGFLERPWNSDCFQKAFETVNSLSLIRLLS